jgi:glycosyltransferase involved in cell wall biosynthesis
VKISILAFDLSDNSTGRAHLLAQLLAPRYQVSIVGPMFGATVWRPVQGARFDYCAIPGRRYPGFIIDVARLLRLIDGDVIVASKPRPTSFGVGLLARARRHRPLVVDIDDWELGFFYRARLWGRVGRFLNLTNPNGLPWTWLMERLIARADAVTVASRFLAAHFGGTLIPHVRDTDAWDPARFDRLTSRRALGLPDGKVVMFLGTPRGHKGVEDLVDAVGSLLNANVILALVGVEPETRRARQWGALPFVRLFPPIAFDDVPRYLAAADVVAVPQRATMDTVGQVPAKLFDAMALARPIVSTTVSMIPEILDGCGVVVEPGDVKALADGLARLLADPAAARELGRRARERCVADYSFRAARARLFPLIDGLRR